MPDRKLTDTVEPFGRFINHLGEMKDIYLELSDSTLHPDHAPPIETTDQTAGGDARWSASSRPLLSRRPQTCNHQEGKHFSYAPGKSQDQ